MHQKVGTHRDMSIHTISSSIIMCQWNVEQCIAIVMNHAQLMKGDTRMSRSEVLDTWHTAAASGSKSLRKKLPVKFTLLPCSASSPCWWCRWLTRWETWANFCEQSSQSCVSLRLISESARIKSIRPTYWDVQPRQHLLFVYMVERHQIVGNDHIWYASWGLPDNDAPSHNEHM